MILKSQPYSISPSQILQHFAGAVTVQPASCLNKKPALINFLLYNFDVFLNSFIIIDLNGLLDFKKYLLASKF